MKKIKFLITSFLFLMITSNALFAQVFDVDTIVYNGNTDKFINIVILGDGYTSAEMNKFVSDAYEFKNYFFSKAPYSNYKNYFNIFLIKTPSNESGVKHPDSVADCGSATETVPVTNPDNYFGSTFDAYGIHRLVVPMNTSLIVSVLANNFPDYDQVFVLANSPYYGGSGGIFATSTLAPLSNEIAIHEIGHSFAGLADEYWAGTQYAEEKANMTKDNNSNTIKWKNWLTSGSGIGIYQHSGQSWYKPANGTCEMEYLNKSFCAVCAETIVEKIHQLTTPVRKNSPLSSTIAITIPVYFSLDLIKTIPNTIDTEWSVNGTIYKKNVDSVLISPSMLNMGENSVSVKVIDNTSLTRNNDHSTSHLYVTNWTITKNTTGIQEISTENYLFDVKLYPNPSTDVLNILFMSEKTENVNISIFSGNGVLIQKINNQKRENIDNTITIDISNFAVGSYYVEFNTDTFTHTEKFIKQ